MARCGEVAITTSYTTYMVALASLPDLATSYRIRSSHSHLERMNGNRNARIVAEAVTLGNKRRWRLRATWKNGLEDDLTRLGRQRWKSEARDCEQWNIVANRFFVTVFITTFSIFYVNLTDFIYYRQPRSKFIYSFCSILSVYIETRLLRLVFLGQVAILYLPFIIQDGVWGVWGCGWPDATPSNVEIRLNRLSKL